MDTHRKKAWHERFGRWGYFLGALLIHVLILLLIASRIIWKGASAPHDEVFNGVAIKVPSPPVQPPASGGPANNPTLVPIPVLAPAVALPNTITTSQNSAFTVDTSKALSQSLSHLSNLPAQGTGLSTGGGGQGNGMGNVFGSATGTITQLVGYFWDLKETADKKPTDPEMERSAWLRIAQKFVDGGWHDQDLREFYKSPLPLYTNCFAISTRDSEEAPRAFNLTDVKPGLWLIHYKASVIPPDDGEYTFVGFGDDILAVKVNGHIVLDAGVCPVTSNQELHKLYPYVWDNTPGNERRLRLGQHFHVRGGEPIDMDVLIGDLGGLISFYLFIQKEGETYETMNDADSVKSSVSSFGQNYEVVTTATPKLPFFMLDSSSSAPPQLSSAESPPTSGKVISWQGSTPTSSDENK